MRGNAQVLLLGPVRIEVDGADAEIPPKARMLAARLAVSAPKVVPNDVLIEELWQGNPPASVRKSLHKYVWELRSRMGDGSVVTEGPGYRLVAGTDIAVLERLVADARAAMAEGQPEKASPLLEEALTLFRGRPLQGFDDLGFAGWMRSGSRSKRIWPRSSSTWAATPRRLIDLLTWWPRTRYASASLPP
jgi:DNA-binding SARP family transcriptional activator